MRGWLSTNGRTFYHAANVLNYMSDDACRLWRNSTSLTSHKLQMDPLGPELVIVDNRGQERSAEFVGDVMEPVAVGTILVAKAWGTREGLAAYAVGEEEYQVGVDVGHGPANSYFVVDIAAILFQHVPPWYSAVLGCSPFRCAVVLVLYAWRAASKQPTFQIFIVGNGVACSPTLLTQENYAELGGIW